MSSTPQDWSATAYLAFAEERTRPARDLLAAVRLEAPRRIVDLGCGPGNSTALLAARWPQAVLTGLDASPDMLAAARRLLPDARFDEADVAAWRPRGDEDLVFANALFQWVPDHLGVLAAILRGLGQGAVLAVQMPDNLDEPSHAAMRATAGEGRWAARLRDAGAARDPVPPAEDYYDRLVPLAARVEIWRTVYHHRLADLDAIGAWFRSSGLKPYLDPLPAAEQDAFMRRYRERIAPAYPRRADGSVLLRFPRLFVVAERG